MSNDQIDMEMLQSALGEVQEFRAIREYVMEVACFPPKVDVGGSFGKPPFAVEDGETCYAVMFAKGDIRPLPYGYELDEEDVALGDDAVLYCHMVSAAPSGLVRYVPLSASFELPDESAFELERLADELGVADETGATENDGSAYEFEGLVYDGLVFLDEESEEPFNGRAAAHWPDGSLRKKAQFVDGVPEGKMTWWYENGQKELEDNYAGGVRHGTHRTWHENGERWAECDYVNGQRQGIARWWYDTGQIYEETEYQDELAHGKCEKWHENGNKAMSTNFVDGYENGIQKEWYKSGELASELTVVDGEVHGTARYWHENGALKMDSEWENGEYSGVSREWDEDGNLLKELK